MATLGVLKSTISDDLARSDLTNQIASAISDSIAAVESERFWFNETRSITFSTVASQVGYGAADNALIPNLIRIDAVFFVESATNIWPLERYAAPDFELVANDGSTGKPTCYTYADAATEGERQIRLWPTPDATYTMRVHGVYRLTALADDADSNAWTTDALELIRAEAEARLWFFVIRDYEKAAASKLVAQGARDRLRAETSSRTGIGRIMPTEF